jgi:flagellar biosynthesis protein FliP
MCPSLRNLNTIANMGGKTSIEVGLAGSITMIVLTTAFVFLLTSFYRRYKRIANRLDDFEQNEDK